MTQQDLIPFDEAIARIQSIMVATSQVAENAKQNMATPGATATEQTLSLVINNLADVISKLAGNVAFIALAVRTEILLDHAAQESAEAYFTPLIEMQIRALQEHLPKNDANEALLAALILFNGSADGSIPPHRRRPR